MKKLKNLLRQQEFHAFVFCLCLILFSYPLLIMTNIGHPKSVYFSLFIPWATIIVGLFFISRSYVKISSDEVQDREDGDMNNV